jgi:hypothetical protein
MKDGEHHGQDGDHKGLVRYRFLEIGNHPSEAKQ